MSRRIGPSAVRGVTLVELMVALVIGLIVTGAALAVFVTNRQTYIASENLGRIQESSRIAFELMSRDIREAGGGVCGNGLGDIANVLQNPTSSWYTDFGAGLRAYPGDTAFPDAAFGTAAGDRIAGTQAIELKSAFEADASVASHTPTSAEFKTNTVNHGLAVGDIALACDAAHAAIFQITNSSPGTNVTVVHNTGTSVPGNCTKGLGSPVDCTSTNGIAYEFGCAYGGTKPTIDCTLPENRWTAYLAKMEAMRWYVGCNGRADCALPAGRSLYRSRLINNAGTIGVTSDEIAPGVTDLDFQFLMQGGVDYVANATTIAWADVLAVDIVASIEGQNLVDGERIERPLHSIVTLRSRAP